MNATAVSPDDRKSPRIYLQQAAVLDAGPGRRAAVQVVNVSAHGMMVETPSRFATGRPVSVEVDGVGDISGKVAWVRDGHVGIAFAKPLTLEQMHRFD